MDAFGYDTWTALLGAVVTPEGKVDYGRLLARPRALLDDSSRSSERVSPESHPDALPHRRRPPRLLDQRLQRVHAARDPRRVPDHLGLEDARRPVLPAPPPRGRRAARSASTTSSTRSCAAASPSRASTSRSTAARTAARRCGPRAYEADGLRDTLRAATAQFLAQRVELPPRSRRPARPRLPLFKMYAEDFAGPAAPTDEYRARRAALRRRAHSASPLERSPTGRSSTTSTTGV